LALYLNNQKQKSKEIIKHKNLKHKLNEFDEKK